MYKYFFISILVILFLYLVKLKQIETFVSQPVTVTGGPGEENTSISPNADSIFYKNGVYLTNNKINYEYIDNKVDLLTRQYNNIDYLYKNFMIKIKNVVTGTNPNENPNMIIGGSYPNNIELSFSFPPPKPGIPGEIGEKGDQGSQGNTGIQGIRGPNGPFGTCP